MEIGTVEGLWRYPVKSMLGEALDGAMVGERGLEGDRAYALLDCSTGRVASAKHPRLWGKLFECRAVTGRQGERDAPGVVRVVRQDGSSIGVDDQGVDAALSEMIGREVTLSAVVPEGAELEKYWPDIEGLPMRDAFVTGGIGWGAPPGTFFDYAPLHLLTTATLDRLQALYPAGQFAARRFRPNLVIAPANGVSGFVENEWVGRTLLIGEDVRIRVIDPTPRCVATTLAQAGLPRDVGILRTVAAHNRPPVPALNGEVMPCAGVYATVLQGGIVGRGDVIRLSR